MADLALILRLLLAGVFAVAAVGKLADRHGSRDALRGFGVPTALVGLVAVLLPSVELAAAAALTASATAWYGAVAALALLVGFLVVLGANLAVGRTPPCPCFGARTDHPIGARTLARTGALALLAGAVVALGRTDAGADLPAGAATLLSGAGTLVFALGAAVLALLAGGVALIAQYGRLLRRIELLEHQLVPATATAPARDPDPMTHGLPVGAPAPAFAVTGPDGHHLGLDDARAAGRPVVLVFTDPDCGPCQALRPELESWRRRHAGALTIVELDRRFDVAPLYRVHATPTAISVAADGTIASPPALGAPAIAELVTRTAGPATDEDVGIPPALRGAQTAATTLRPRGARAPQPRPTTAPGIRTGVHWHPASSSAGQPVAAAAGAHTSSAVRNAPTRRTA